LNRLGRKVKWNVRVCARYEHGRGVSVYLARYVKGGPFRNTQIAHASERQIVFRYTPHSEEGQPKRSATLRLAPAHFLARVLAHAPEPNRHSVRYYGLYAHACAEPLNCARALHQQLPVQPTQPIAWQSYLARFPRALAAAHCPRCHAPLVRGALIVPNRAPP
jgi:hypothetical protein